MSRLLLDTHIWIWYTTGSKQLPASLREAIDDSLGACWLSAISIWEASVLAERGRIRATGSFSAALDHMLREFPVHEAPVNFEIARRSRELELDHQDPADRFIAATAQVLGLTLVTLDERLSASRSLEILTV